jgi:nucleoside phosphorylase
VLHVGLAGARGFAGVEAVIGDEAVYTDAAASRTLVPSRARPAATLLAAARRALPAARVGAIATTARVGGSVGLEIEAMEGFAVLRACELAAVPAVEVRVVVNEVDEPDRSRWRFDEGFALLRAIAPRLLEELRA